MIIRWVPQTPKSTYKGQGGVKIGSFWRKLLFTLRFRDTEILFTGALKPESHVMFNRNVREALEEVAPFLIYDNDTYPVILGGKILWVQDAFTWSHRYPYSKPVATGDKTLVHFNGVNYIRNSVKTLLTLMTGRWPFTSLTTKIRWCRRGARSSLDFSVVEMSKGFGRTCAILKISSRFRPMSTVPII